MRMTPLALSLTLALTLAAAGGDSMTNESVPGSQPFGLSVSGADPCHAADFEYLIGEPAPDAEAIAALEGPKRVRVIGPDDMVTMDHVPQRLNIETDAEGIVLRLRCG